MSQLMDRGIWAIWYDVDAAQRREYEQWFHEIHIPDKLSRPGYLWAAHYELVDDKGFLALFGAATTHVFLNPSPAQLAQRQSPETKRFIGLRRNASACILAEEARVDGPDAEQRGAKGTPGAVIQLGNYNAESPAVEDDLGAWYAQERLPLLGTLPGCIGARKMLATVGDYKHAILHEFVSLELREHHFGPHEAQARDPATWMGRVRPRLAHAPRSPAVGFRIWPLPAGHARLVYKVLRAPEWKDMESRGAFSGSPDDLRDGFIHFSTAEQLEATIERHFAGQRDLVVLEVDAAALGDKLRWEPSRGGALFPHLYGELPLEAVLNRHVR